MKICLCGKGGSGKSTIVALMSADLLRAGRRVLVIDSDESNQGLYWMLGFDHPPVPIMELAGGKKNVRKALRTAAATSGDDDGPVLARAEIHPHDLPAENMLSSGGLSLVCIGKIHQSLEGCACPMGVLCREFLKKLRTREGEVAIVDMEAGVEHFGRGIETSLDAVLVVVEPSLESVGLARRIKDLSSGAGATFAGAVLNKVDTEDTAARLHDALAREGVPVVTTLPFDRQLYRRALEGGSLIALAEALELPPIADAVLAQAAEVGSGEGSNPP